MKNLVSLFLSLLALVGCALGPIGAPSFSDAPSPPSGYALVYVLRTSSGPLVANAQINIGGEVAAELPRAAYSWVYVKAGTKTVEAAWQSILVRQPSTLLVLQIEEGRVYFVRIHASMFAGGAGALLASRLDTLAPQQGVAELKGCCSFVKASTDRID